MTLPTWQSLIEKFLTSVDHGGDYTEIYENPTPAEWAKAGGRYVFQPTWNLKYGTSGFLTRGLLTIGGDSRDETLYVWNGDKSSHGPVISWMINERLLSGRSGIDFLPLDLMYIPQTKTVSVGLATFSMEDSARMPRIERIMDLCKDAPAFRGLTVVNDGPLTEAFFKDITVTTTGGIYGDEEMSGPEIPIYHNPTWSELISCGSGDPATHNGVKYTRMVGALLTPKGVYVWNRNMAVHHEVMTKIRSEIGVPIIPLYFYYNPGVKSLLIIFAPCYANADVQNTTKRSTIMDMLPAYLKDGFYQIVVAPTEADEDADAAAQGLTDRL